MLNRQFDCATYAKPNCLFDNYLDSVISGSRYGAVDALVVVRYGSVVVEKYNNWSPDRAHTMQSVSKSITSLLVGILQSAKSDGSASVDRPVVDRSVG